MPFGSNVYSVRFCMPAYSRCQGVGWNILRRIHAYPFGYGRKPTPTGVVRNVGKCLSGQGGRARLRAPKFICANMNQVSTNITHDIACFL